MAKRIQDQKEEKVVVSKSRPSVNCYSYLIATSSSAVSSPTASKSPRAVGASGRPGSRMTCRDAYLGGLKDELQEHFTQKKEQISEESDNEPWYYKPVPQNKESCGKTLAGETAESSSAVQKVKRIKTLQWITSLPNRQKQSIFRKPSTTWSGRSTEDHPDVPMEDLSVNMAIWGFFFEFHSQTAIHLENDHDANLRNVKNSFWISAGQLFRVDRKFGQRSDRNRWHKRD